MINSTKWPSLLGTDSASKRRVSKRIIYLSLIATVASILITVASAIAPLGLHNDSYATNPDPVPFSYVHDDSPIGGATASRGDYMIDRGCGWYIDINCPGANGGYITFSNDSGYFADAAPGVQDPYINVSVPPNITDAFTSATNTEGNTISSIFDIRYRSYFNYANKTVPKGEEWINQGKPFTQGVPRFFQSLIMDNKIEPIEGLVVDMVNGGVGFRNHTLPPASPYGTTWSEDLLWLEPDTICVNLNVSLDYTLAGPGDSETGAMGPRLTDRGGIVNAQPERVKVINFKIGQSDPQLYQRAYMGAVGTLSNIVTGFDKINVTKRLGDTYPLTHGSSSYAPDKVSFMQFSDSDTSFTMPDPIEVTDPFKYNFTAKPQYFNVWLNTQAYGSGDFVDINTIHITTGLVLGAGAEVDANGEPITPAPKVQNIAPMTHWSQPLFSCASGIKASVKTVDFRMEGDALVSNLKVENVVPRTYTASDIPLWGVEKPGFMIQDFDAYWGLVSSRYASVAGLQTFKSERLYLPATSQSVSIISGGWGLPARDSNAGGNLPTQAMAAVWAGSSDGIASGVPDYSGQTQFAMFQKWAKLSSDAISAGKILDLMWTDLMANGAVGAKGLLSSSGSSSATSASQDAVVYDQGVQYDWVYAIPGFFLLLLYLILLLVALVLLCTRKISIGLMRYMLNHTSAGRAITAERYGHRDENAAPTRYWADTVGSEQVRVTKRVPQSSLGYEGVVENIEMIRHLPKSN